jgi:hypothetical protein
LHHTDVHDGDNTEALPHIPRSIKYDLLWCSHRCCAYQSKYR